MKTKRKRQSHGCSLPLVGWFIVIFILTISFYISIDLKNHLSRSIVGSDVVISFPEILDRLNSDWKSRVRHVQPLYDLIGRPNSLVMRIDEEFYNIHNSEVFVNYSVMTYTDSLSAQNRYDTQINTVFLQSNFWKDNNLNKATLINADKAHSECFLSVLENGDQAKKCATLLLYDKHVVFVGMSIAVGSVIHIDDELIVDIFALIDDTMKEILAESG